MALSSPRPCVTVHAECGQPKALARALVAEFLRGSATWTQLMTHMADFTSPSSGGWAADAWHKAPTLDHLVRVDHLP